MHDYLVFAEVPSTAIVNFGTKHKIRAIGGIKANNSVEACQKAYKSKKCKGLLLENLKACIVNFKGSFGLEGI